jgi:segregation and condensation protein B
MTIDQLTGDETLGAAAEHASPGTLSALVESLLFVAAEPLTVARLAAALLVESEQIEEALQALDRDLVGRGICLQRKDDKIQLATRPATAAAIERLLGVDTSPRLSPAALEALAVIAYRQPVTRTQLEAIRGVNCDGVLRTLLSRSLIEEQGRLDAVGRPILFGTTFEFLQYFGLSRVEDLPPLPEALVAELAARDAQAVASVDEKNASA